MSQLYCHVQLPNAGLANRLFPWARCTLFARDTGARMLAPSWVQFKIGPLLRGERDLRLYHDLFRPAPNEVTGLRKYYLLATAPRVSETEQPPQSSGWSRSPIVEFEGQQGFFNPIHHASSYLHSQLRTITREKWKVSVNEGFPIGIHVRRGDFVEPEDPSDFQTDGALRTPLSWFIEGLQAIRAELGRQVGAFVVSDGSADTLAPLADLPNVKLLRAGSAIGDLLALAQAKVILGSGGSSFTAWGHFLSRAPVAVISGQDLSWFNLEWKDRTLLHTFDAAPPSFEFISSVDDVLSNVSSTD